MQMKIWRATRVSKSAVLHDDVDVGKAENAYEMWQVKSFRDDSETHFYQSFDHIYSSTFSPLSSISA